MRQIAATQKPAGSRASALWLIPLAYFAVSLVIGLTLPRAEHYYFPRLANTMSVASAQAAFSSITSGMMALTGILFSIAFVVAQFSSTAYSPRLTLIFSRDRTVFNALGLFISTFIYSLSALVWIDRDGSGHVPFVSSLLVGILLAASMVALARLIMGLNQLQISYVLTFLGNEGRKIIKALYTAPYSEEAGRQAKGEIGRATLSPVSQVIRYHGEPLYVADVDIGTLVSRVSEAGAVVTLDCAVGDVLTDDAVVARVHGGTTSIADASVLSAVHLAIERTFVQDPKYAIRLLVDIAIRALSPAVNDPTTAVQAMDQIEDLLSRLGRCVLQAGRFSDDHGDLRVVLPTPTWDDFLSLAFDEIRQYGADSLQVMRRLRSALGSLAETVPAGPRRDSVAAYLQHLNETVSRSAFDTEDRAAALAADKQGLGVSRPAG